MLTKSPKEAPDKPGDVTISFEAGRPISVNGKKSVSAVALLEELNAIEPPTASAASIWSRTVLLV